jgi:hypothetical protein
VIRLVVLMYVRFPLSLSNVEDLMFERGIDICHETVRHWWNQYIQGTPLRRTGGVADARCLKASAHEPSSAQWRPVRKGLTGSLRSVFPAGSA